MKRTYPLLLLAFLATNLYAASGGPDQYGYIWKDSNEPDGPVYEWIDITGSGIAITDLADDNTHGPIVMDGNMPFYWYDVKNVWVGSNGYVAFDGGNIAATFPTLPAAGGTDNYIAAFMSDLTFAGTGNPGQCFVLDEAERLVVSWINAPFWSPSAPGYVGSNTFQLILNKLDSTITIQYQSTSGTTGSNGPVIGIESIIGSVGLARSQSMMPPAGYAVRFYNPAVPLLDVKDAAVDWVGVQGTKGTTMAVGDTMSILTRVLNTGNQPLDAFSVTSKFIGPNGQTVLTETAIIGGLQAAGSFIPSFDQVFTATAPGTYWHRVTISGIPGEMVATNNELDREVVVYPTTVNTQNVGWAGPNDDAAGLGWNGGDGGIGAYIIPPYYPCRITGTTVRIQSNIGTSFSMMVYDDDGPGGGPGTLLDSAVITGNDAAPGDHVYPLSSPIDVTEGGYYVAWYMLGTDVRIAVDDQPPFSRQCYEVLGMVWAEYREMTTTDFHLGLQVEHPPFTDVGVQGLVGITEGQFIEEPTLVQALVRNYGNTPAGDFTVHYRFNEGQVVSQPYTGGNIAPGNSGLVSFNQLLDPDQPGSLCVWTQALNDDHPENDTLCLSIQVSVGISEQLPPRPTLFPNPVSNRLTVQGIQAAGAVWRVMDAQGRVALEGNVPGGASELKLPVHALRPGVYLLRCTSGETTWQGRFVVWR